MGRGYLFTVAKVETEEGERKVDTDPHEQKGNHRTERDLGDFYLLN